MIKNTSSIEKIFLISMVLLFLVITLIDLKYVGIVGGDEIVPSIPIVQILKNFNYEQYSSKVEIVIGDKHFPVNYVVPYVFSLPQYLLIPFFLVFGVNIIALKLMPIVLTVFLLLFIYFILKEIFSNRIAGITILLLVLSPIFTQNVMIGNFTTEPILSFFFIGSILLYLLYKKTNNKIFLFLGVLFLGCTLSIKITAIIRIVGLFAAILIFKSDAVREVFRIKNILKLLIVLVVFMIGSSLFVYFNIATKGGSFDPRGLKAAMNSEAQSVKILDKIPRRIYKLKNFLSGYNQEDIIYEQKVYNGRILKNTLLNLIIFMIAMVFAIIYSLIYNNDNYRKELQFIFTVYMVFLLFLIFSPLDVRMLHFGILFPFPQLVLAVFFDNIALLFKKSRVIYMQKINIYPILFLIMLPKLVFSSQIQVAYHKAYRALGGYEYSAPYINELSNFIMKKDIKKIFVIDVGISDIINFITKGKTEATHVYREWTADENTIRKSLIEQIKKEERCYFVSMFGLQQKEGSKRNNWLNQDVKIANKTLKEIKSIKHLNGSTVYIVYEAR